MPVVHNESDNEISRDMFKDGFNFLPFKIPLGSFLCEKDIPEISQFSISTILKYAN